MIVLLGRSEEKNMELKRFVEYMELPCICVDLYKKASPYGYTPWTYYSMDEMSTFGRPLFWLELAAPRHWSFRAGDIRRGQIYNGDELLANVYFRQPFEDQCIDRIEWIRNGDVYAVDYYSACGLKYAEAIVNNGVEAIVTYPDRSGIASVVEWNDTGFISVQKKTQVELYENQEQFFAAFMRDIMSEYRKEAVIISEPELSKYIPEGCRSILYLQDRDCEKMADQSFKKPISLIIASLPDVSNPVQPVVDEGKQPEVIEVGRLIDTSVRGSAQDALIVTRSQNIEQLQILVEGLPEMTFHIAAGTIMAPGLMDFNRYPNVLLYPNSPRNKILDLMRRCAFYLDINHYLEYDGIVSSALMMNRLVYAFDNTVHQRASMHEGQIYLKEEVELMVSDISRAMFDPGYMKELLGRQRKRIEINDEQKEVLRKVLTSR